MENCEDQICVFLWALPRSVSTALTKCMTFVDGAQIWYEPYLYSYHNEKLQDPAVIKKMAEFGMNFQEMENMMKSLLNNITVGKRMKNELFSFPWVKKQLETQDPEKKVIFIKDMAHVMNNHYEHLPTTRKYRHTFLIRHPSRMFPSFKNMMMKTIPEEKKNNVHIVSDVFMYDVDKIYKYTRDLWKYTQENLDPNAVIIDGTELATYPEKLLPKYFKALGIPFEEKYLTWDPNPDVMQEWKAALEPLIGAYKMDVIKSAVDSSHFIAPDKEAPSRTEMSLDVIKCIDESLPYYDEMFDQRIKP